MVGDLAAGIKWPMNQSLSNALIDIAVPTDSSQKRSSLFEVDDKATLSRVALSL